VFILEALRTVGGQHRYITAANILWGRRGRMVKLEKPSSEKTGDDKFKAGCAI